MNLLLRLARSLLTVAGTLLVLALVGASIIAPADARAQTAAIPEPSCYAAPLGSGTMATEVKHSAGIGRYWWCQKGDTWTTQVTAQANGYRLVIPTDVPASAPMSQLLAAAWRANVTRDCGPASTDPVIGAICRATWVVAKADPNRPKNKVWRVAPNPSSTSIPPTRPMWDPTATKQVAERATVGALCDCAKPVAKSTQTLCPLSPFTGPGASLPDLPPAELAAWLAARNLTACVRVDE